jgi:hypothetical protein
LARDREGEWMGSKKAEVIDIVVDDLALSLVGWQVEDAQARLVTASHDSSHTLAGADRQRGWTGSAGPDRCVKRAAEEAMLVGDRLTRGTALR